MGAVHTEFTQSSRPRLAPGSSRTNARGASATESEVLSASGSLSHEAEGTHSKADVPTWLSFTDRG